DARNRAHGREVVERVANLTPREPADRKACDRGVGAHPHRGGDPWVCDAIAAEPSHQSPRERPKAPDRDQKRDDRDRAEVPDPRTEDRVVDGARDERVAGTGPPAAPAPGEEQRDQRDERQRAEVERRTAEAEQDTRGGRGPEPDDGGAAR